MASRLSFVTLDVFTQSPFRGNPLALVRVPRAITLAQDQKQRIARELNLSETVFLHEQTEDEIAKELVRIDIFTSIAEVPFAGHPTVGTANYLLRLLGDAGLAKVKAMQLKAGLFGIELDQSLSGVRIALAHDVHIHSTPFPDQPFSRHPVVSIVKGMTFILEQLGSLEELGAKTRGHLSTGEIYTAHAALDEGWRQGLVGSYFFVDQGYEEASSGRIRKIRTRFLGSREDPATGSAASALTSYLSLQEGKAGAYKYHLTQGVEMGQRSEIYVEVLVKEGPSDKNLEIAEVFISGSAVLNIEGTIAIPE